MTVDGGIECVISPIAGARIRREALYRSAKLGRHLTLISTMLQSDNGSIYGPVYGSNGSLHGFIYGPEHGSNGSLHGSIYDPVHGSNGSSHGSIYGPVHGSNGSLHGPINSATYGSVHVSMVLYMVI